MNKLMMIALFAVVSMMGTQSLHAQCNSHSKAVKTSHHHKSSDVVDIAISSDVHTTLVAAVKAAGLVETLKSEGPFTVFAPTNTAFAKLPAGTVDNLLKKENKSSLSKILTYHVIAGSFTAAEVMGAIKANNGEATFTTVSGGKLKAALAGDSVILEDEMGNKSAITAVDLKGSNGVVHVIDSVVLPN